MVTSVYNVLKAAQPEFDFSADVNLTFKDIGSLSEETLNIVKYSVAKGYCTEEIKKSLTLKASVQQELLVFVKNAYEFAIYESGRYSKGAFWKVSDENNTVYLLGSIHIADATLYPLSKEILNAYEKSDVLVVEADISKQEEAANYMAQRLCTQMKTLLRRMCLKSFTKNLWSLLLLMVFRRKYTASSSPGMQHCWFKTCSLWTTHYSGSLEWICISFQRQWAKKTYWK